MNKFKRFLRILLLIFLLASSANAGWNPYILKTTFGQVADSTGSTYNRGDFTSTNAFFWSSIDLSPYAGTDLGYTPFRIVAIDGAGKEATGYLAGVGAGETLGSELITDPGFDVSGDWTKGGGWTVVAGQAIANTTGTAVIYQLSPSLTMYQLFKHVMTCSLLTSGTYQAAALSGPYGAIYSDAGTKSCYGNALSTGITGVGINDTTALIATFDSISYKRVIDPPSTAIHIVSALNGTVRDWASIESGFDPNIIASWKIYRL